MLKVAFDGMNHGARDLPMARQERDREDLLLEATALTPRVQLKVAAWSESLVIGFRSDGAASLYFGTDPVYQFNARGQLRRGFQQGDMIKAVKGHLIKLHRQRSGGQVQLLRKTLSDDEQHQYLQDLLRRLDTLRDALRQGTFHVEGQVPSDADAVGQVRAWLAATGPDIEVAGRPNVGG